MPPAAISPSPPRPVRRNLGGFFREQVVARHGGFDLAQAGERSLVEDLPPLLARAGAQIDEMVGDRHEQRMVIDDDDRVAGRAQSQQMRQQPLDVFRMQPRGRLLEQVERIDERRQQHLAEPQPLRLAERQRRQSATRGKPVEPQLAESREALDDPLARGRDPASPSRRLAAQGVLDPKRRSCRSAIVNPCQRSVRAFGPKRRPPQTGHGGSVTAP